jgi:hypothetical protein
MYISKTQNFKSMKKLLSVIFLLVTLQFATAQNIRLNGYGAYVFDDKIDTYYSGANYYSGTINGGARWGAGIEFMLKEAYGLELSYLRQDTKAPINVYIIGSYDERREFDVSMNWIMLGGMRYLKKNPRVEPYGGGQLGVVIIDVSNPLEGGGSNSATKFAWGLRGGVVLWAAEKLGIRLQADLYSGVQAVGGGLYFGTGGAGAGLSTYSSLLQFGLGGGIALKLGGAAK